jgi:hypothetical protein
MKLITARFLSVFTACTLLFLLLMNVFNLNAVSLPTSKKIQFQKHQLSDNITNFIEDIEEDEEEEFNDSQYFTDVNSFQCFDFCGVFILKTSKTNLLKKQHNSITNVPKWLLIRHIIL